MCTYKERKRNDERGEREKAGLRRNLHACLYIRRYILGRGKGKEKERRGKTRMRENSTSHAAVRSGSAYARQRTERER